MATRRGRRPAEGAHPTPDLFAALKFFASMGMKSGSLVHFADSLATFDTGACRYFRNVAVANWQITIDGHRLLKAIERQTTQITFTVTADRDRLSVDSSYGADAIPCTPIERTPVLPTFWKAISATRKDELTRIGTLAKAIGIESVVLIPATHGFGMVVGPAFVIQARGIIASLPTELPGPPDGVTFSAAALARLGKTKLALAGLGYTPGEPGLALFLGQGPAEATALQLGAPVTKPMHEVAEHIANNGGHAWQEIHPAVWVALRQLQDGSKDDLARFAYDGRDPRVCSDSSSRVVAMHIPDGACFSLAAMLALEGHAVKVAFVEMPERQWALWFEGDDGLRGALLSIVLGEVTVPSDDIDAEIPF